MLRAQVTRSTSLLAIFFAPSNTSIRNIIRLGTSTAFLSSDKLTTWTWGFQGYPRFPSFLHTIPVSTPLSCFPTALSRKDTFQSTSSVLRGKADGKSRAAAMGGTRQTWRLKWGGSLLTLSTEGVWEPCRLAKPLHDWPLWELSPGPKDPLASSPSFFLPCNLLGKQLICLLSTITINPQGKQ